MDQIYRWAIIEAGEGGIRNFGLPMNVDPFYNTTMPDPMLWGFKVSIFKEGTHLCDLGIMFDQVGGVVHRLPRKGHSPGTSHTHNTHTLSRARTHTHTHTHIHTHTHKHTHTPWTHEWTGHCCCIISSFV